MSILYIIQQKLISVGSNPGLKFLARIFRGQIISQKVIAKEIADKSSLSVGDVYNVLESLREQIGLHLSQGHSVKLNLLGTFYSSIKAKAQETKEDVKSTSIENVFVGFLATKDLITVVRAAGLKYLDTNIKGVQYRDSLELVDISDDSDQDIMEMDIDTNNIKPKTPKIEKNPDID
ncbi:MAG: HU family DNA-binding protein [Bacteroidales bacterium]